MAWVKCYHCSYEWNYRGSHKTVIVCPRCRKLLYVSKLKRLNYIEID